MKLVTLTVNSWDGELPRLGEFIKSERGRTAFKIVEIVRPTRPGTKHVCRFRCERHFALQNTDVVHAWQWSKR